MTALIAKTDTKRSFYPTDKNASLSIWVRWVVANAGAELIGLGTSALLWIAMLTWMDATLGILLSALLVVIGSTILEGAAVGYGQWLVLRRLIPELRWQSWLVATAIGAFIAWTLGMIPSTLMNLAESSSATASAGGVDMGIGVMLLLAVGMGLVLGPILAWPQWLVLRRYLDRAIWWIPANALAWAAGMAIIFAASSSVSEGSLTWVIVATVLVSLMIAGAAVGAIHGLALLWMVHNQQAETV